MDFPIFFCYFLIQSFLLPIFLNIHGTGHPVTTLANEKKKLETTLPPKRISFTVKLNDAFFISRVLWL